MRTFLFSVLLSSSLIAQNSAESYPIKQVTVYKSGAEVERLAQLNLKAGENKLTFSGLSAQLDPKSVQVKGLSSLNLISISHSSLSNDSLKNHPEIQALELQIEAKLQERQGILDQKEGLLLEQKYLESNSNLGGTNGYTLSQLREVSQFVKQERSANAKAISKLNLAQKELQKEVSNFRNQLAEKIKELQALNRSIHIRLISPKAQKLSLSLHYQIYQAGWNSNYDLKVNSLDQPIQLAHKAVIYQNSGEDWENVSLVLNTGSMQANGQIPSLSPEYLMPIIPNSNRAKPSMMAAEMDYQAKKDSRLNAQEGLTAFRANSVKNNLLSRSFSIANKVTIFSGKSETNLLRDIEIPAIFEYQAVPKIDPSAYLIAKIYQWTDYNLEAGELSLYNAGNFVGKSYLDPNLGQDTLELSLGKDDDIIVKRETLKEEAGSSFLGSQKTVKYAYNLSVFNKKSKPITIVLIDQVPLAKHEDINVKMTFGKLTVSDLAEGKIQWRFSVPSQEKVSKKHQYQVSYPKDMRLNFN